MNISVASFSTIDSSFCILTGEYEPAVSTNIKCVPESTFTFLNDIPLVLTFFPDGKLDYVRLFNTNVFPLSYSPTTATVAPSHPALYYYYASIP